MRKKIGMTFAAFNNVDLTLRCLRSICDNGSKNDLYIVVVDNGSRDGTQSRIKKEFPDVEVIRNNKNLGCAIAWNQGLEKCLDEKCDFLTLTQNDVIISKGVIDKSVEYLEDNKYGVKLVSPATINVPFVSGKNLKQDELNVISEKAKDEYKGSIHRDFCIYFVTMIPEIFEKFKFDENFKKVLYEDIDFYNTLILNKIPSCSNMDLGLLFHRYSATQIMAHNSSPGSNGAYFNKKWEKNKEQVKKNAKEIIDKLPINIKYPKCKRTNLFFDVEEAGMHKWK